MTYLGRMTTDEAEKLRQVFCAQPPADETAEEIGRFFAQSSAVPGRWTAVFRAPDGRTWWPWPAGTGPRGVCVLYILPDQRGRGTGAQAGPCAEERLVQAEAEQILATYGHAFTAARALAARMGYIRWHNLMAMRYAGAPFV